MTDRQIMLTQAVTKTLTDYAATPVEAMCILCGMVAAIAAGNQMPYAEIDKAISKMYSDTLVELASRKS
jgi:hypothetical protein